jgi:hypothetical protein
MLSEVDMQVVRQLYLNREKIHEAMLKALKEENVDNYLQMALGLTKGGTGNFSADEHQLGWRILEENPHNSIFALAKELYACTSPRKIPGIIYSHKLRYLKISVGSEMAMMLRPDDFWVANVRTVWVHILIKHGDNYKKANEELKYYRDKERTSEMEYRIWADIYRTLETVLVRLHDLGMEEARRQGVEPGDLKFIWADAIANELYTYREEI